MKRRGKFQKQTDEIEQQEELEKAKTFKEETKEDRDEAHFAKQMDAIKRIKSLQKLEYTPSLISLKVQLALSYVELVMENTEEEMKEYWRKLYRNNKLGTAPEKIPLETGLFKF